MRLTKAIAVLTVVLTAALTAASAATASAESPSARYTWDSVAIGGSGFVSAVIPATTKSGAVYARTDVGGAYRWDKASGRWVALLDWASEDETGYLGVDSLAIDPKNPAKIYLLAGIRYLNGGKTAILRSNNYGKTFAVTDVSSQFKTHGNGMGRQNGERLAVDPGSGKVLYAGTRANGLFKSTDSGITWEHMASLDVTTTPNGAGISFVMPDSASVSRGIARRLLVGVSRYGSVGPNLYRSDDAGATFSAVRGAPVELMPQRAVLDGAGNLYITYANGAGPHRNSTQPESMDKGQVWKYNIRRDTWTDVTPAGVAASFSGIDVDRRNPKRLVASTISFYAPQGDAKGDRIFLSTDGGASWTDIIARGFVKDDNGVSWVKGHAIHWASTVAFDPLDPKTVRVTSGNGIFKTSNIDAVPTTWAFDVNGLEESVPLDLVSIPGGPLVSAIGDYDGFRHVDVTRYAPIHTPEIGTTTGLDVAAADTSTLVRVGDAMYYSTDMGASWNKTAAMNGKRGVVTLSADGKTILHHPERSDATYRSADRGGSWTQVQGLSARHIHPVADPVDSGKFYVYDSDSGAVRVSTDGGATFGGRSLLVAGGADRIRVAPGRAGDVWAPLKGAGLARSVDAGATFTSFSNVSYCGAVGFGKSAAGASYPTVFIWGTVDGAKGVYRSTDAGASWTRINDDAHQYGGPGDGHFVVGDMNTFGVVYMSTAGRGIVYGKPSIQ
jgi:xyloglucan-specific exo-beta-1,4-glucanase